MKKIIFSLILLVIALSSVQAQITLPLGYLLNSVSSTNSPIGMDFDSNDRLLIANVQSPPRKITRFELSNGLYASDTVIINFNGNDHRPEFIALDAADQIYFARPDFNTGNLYRLTSSQTIETVYTANFGDLDDPRGIAFNANGDLFVANNAYPNQNSYISKFSFNASNQLISQNLQFIPGISSNAMDLTFAPNGDLYIASGTSIVQVQFDQIGNVQSVNQSFITIPSIAGSLLVGIAIDNDGDMFVSQINTVLNDSGKIYSFDTLGNFSVFASGFNQPRKLIFDNDNRMYVADYANDMIYVIECTTEKRSLNDRFCDVQLSNSEIEARRKSLSFYPNPCDGVLNISLDEISEVDQILVLNSLGQQVKSIYPSIDESISVDFKDNFPGIYVVVGLKNGTVTSQSRLILN